MSDQKPSSNNHQPATNVYAVYGAEPEVQAYAMAKYSRSALSMKESLSEMMEKVWMKQWTGPFSMSPTILKVIDEHIEAHKQLMIEDFNKQVYGDH